jgi:hypothetical protein
VARTDDLLVADVTEGVVDNDRAGGLEAAEDVLGRVTITTGDNTSAAHVIVRAVHALVPYSVDKTIADIAISIVDDLGSLSLGLRFRLRGLCNRPARMRDSTERMLNIKEDVVDGFSFLIVDASLAKIKVEAVQTLVPDTFDDLVASVTPYAFM